MLLKCLKHTRAQVEAVDPKITAGIREFMRQIMTSDIEAKFIQDVFSYIVSGNRLGQFMLIFQGSGSNGKSAMEGLLKSMLGDYCVNADVKLITKKGGGAENAESKLMATRGALCALFPEPGPRDKLNFGKVKQLTGNDGFQAREIYGTVVQATVTM
jgi:phage/plasmid-associated DNA primase